MRSSPSVADGSLDADSSRGRFEMLQPMRKFLAVLAKPFLKIPPIRRAYLRRVLKYLEETPASKLQPEMRAAQALLMRLPKHQRMAALETGIEQGGRAEDVPQSRALRRAAAKEARRRR
jgi:hypothetical protein